jgi:hypothetical protein
MCYYITEKEAKAGVYLAVIPLSFWLPCREPELNIYL